MKTLNEILMENAILIHNVLVGDAARWRKISDQTADDDKLSKKKYEEYAIFRENLAIELKEAIDRHYKEDKPGV